jgi:hypothetical protein
MSLNKYLKEGKFTKIFEICIKKWNFNFFLKDIIKELIEYLENKNISN